MKDKEWMPNDFDMDDDDDDFNDAIEAPLHKEKKGKKAAVEKVDKADKMDKVKKPKRPPITLAPDYFYVDFAPNQKKKAIEDITRVCQRIIKESASKSSLDELKEIMKADNLHSPDSHVKLLEATVASTFKSAPPTPNILDVYDAAKSVIINEAYMVKPMIFESYFFPSTDSEDRLIECMAKVKKSLDVCVFTITNKRIVELLNVAAANGIQMRIISDDTMSTQFNNYSLYELVLKKIPVRLDNNPHVNMHNKFVIIDELVLVTGSFNWTTQAVFKNQENIIMMENQFLIKKYQAEFNRLWQQFEAFQVTEVTAKAVLAQAEKEKIEKAGKKKSKGKAKD